MEPRLDPAEDWLAEFEARGWLWRLDEGLVLLTGPLLSVMRRFDAAFRALAEMHQAEEWAVPSLLPRAMIDRIRYADHFGSTLLRAAGARSDSREISQVLLPSACFHLYLAIEGTRLDPHQGKVLTCAARVFRNEDRLHQFGRLVEFSVREILFFGTSERVAGLAKTLGRQAERIAQAAGLDSALVNAVDPFFFFLGDKEARLKYDIPQTTKQELTVRLSGTQPLALASFNLHGTFFTGQFDIAARSGERLSSGCCGFGLERWTLAFAATHGLDPARWPCIEAPGRPD